MAIIAYPLNNIEYSAEDAMLANLPVSSGVYAEGDNFPITITGAFSATIGIGLGFMRYDTTRGFTFYQNSAENISFDAPDTVLPRIDRVVLRWEEARNGVFVAVKKGSPSSTPVAPERLTDSDNYELVLYDVMIEANTTAIKSSNITDQRLNNELCGVMANEITKLDVGKLLGQAVLYTEQSLSSAEKEQARTNIGAAGKDEIPDVSGKLNKSGDVMTGILTAQSNTAYTTKQVRNIFLIADGETLPSGENGDICLVYTP